MGFQFRALAAQIRGLEEPIDQRSLRGQYNGMNVERLLELARAVPFVPFSVLLPNGEKMRVKHPDFIWVHPDRRTIIVVAENGQTRFLNHQMLLGLELDQVHEA